jgi:RNA polymerase sigma-70 factor (ECF subfamily)
MARYREETTMGGAKNVLETTKWSEICEARTADAARRQAVVNNLIKRYWKPVYCYLRRKGYSNDSAKDLTQGFFHEVVLGRDLIQRADAAKGRFRTLLLTSLDRYVSDVCRKKATKKRAPKRGIVSLGVPELPSLPPAHAEMRPDELFQYAWAADLLDRVLGEVKSECYSAGQGTHWEVFNSKVLVPIIDGSKPPSLAEVCAACGLDTQGKASNMIVTVKRRFGRVLQRHLRRSVQSDSEVEDELNNLIEALSQAGARS